MTDTAKIPDTVDIKKELETTRKKLLDLTMRNRLLNFRPSKARTIKIIDEIPSEIYDHLVLQEKKLQFRSQTGQSGLTENDEPGKSWEIQPDYASSPANSQTWELPAPDPAPAGRHLDSYLQTALDGETLQRKLFYIYQDSQSVLEELGYSTLFLALGFLEWTESADSKETRLAPLILLPVELERAGVHSAFKLSWNSEDITTNISLKEILSLQTVNLPDFEMSDDKESINRYLQSVQNAVASRPRWRVINDIYLGFFSFTKFIMYKDLDPQSWPDKQSPVDHPLIQAIFGSSQSPPENGFQENEVDQKLKAQDIFHLMDADSSQIAVIEDVKSGRNLAVEGPPGTGKSQTIVNIIAELLAADKSVLFVSEKMAALQVVKSRLDEVGLGDFCLELHSRKTNKKEFLNNLQRSPSLSGTNASPSPDEYNLLDSFKNDLNGYAAALREPFGLISRPPVYFYHLKDQSRRYFENLHREMPRIKLEVLPGCDKRDCEDARQRLADLQGILPLIIPFRDNPWVGCSPDIILPSQEDSIRSLLVECIDVLNDMQVKIQDLIEICGLLEPHTLKDVSSAVNAAKVMAVSQPVDPAVLRNMEWNKPSQHAENIINNLKSFQALRSQVLSKFKNEVLNLKIRPVLVEYKNLTSQFFKFLNPRYYRLKREIRDLYQVSPRKSNPEIISDLEELDRCLTLRDVIKGYGIAGRALFGSLWQGEDSEPDLLSAFADWVVAFRRQLLDRVLSEKAVDIVSRGVSQPQIEKASDALNESWKNFSVRLAELTAQVKADYKIIFNEEVENVPLDQLLFRLTKWESGISGLQRWSQYIQIRQQSCQSLIAPLLKVIEADKLTVADLIPCFEGNLADDFLMLIFKERPALARFVGTLHENKIEHFKDLDKKLIQQNRQRLLEKLNQRRPGLNNGASPNSEMGILLGEINRKRGHMPIRKLMSLTGNLVQKIKPCFMMSPLSIAQFLDPKIVCFDVIIFDEASQVRPEDALGALLRGNQVAVIGDTRQLPPTSFFDRLLEDDVEEENHAVAAFSNTESILHQCRRCFPVKNLRWHYRSKHESLIAVSNHEFYEDNLLLYPSPVQQSEDLGLHLIHLPDTVYDRGGSQTNRLEAQEIARRVIEHYRKTPSKSLGVGTFNINQQELIQVEIELQIRQLPKMETFFKSDRPEHFFVKNLETIQGDERDVIFISIGYGLDKFGKMSLGFGPLNKEGGERRLNVLITRARERCVVFSNFKAFDLQIDSGATRGVRALKTFLDYAETRNLELSTPGGDTGSSFEDSVFDFLQSQGYDVKKQVGCAGFRVDLAIVDPLSPGNFLLGIECDGSKYHSSSVSRDRDRLRQQILEKLGWRIYRIWSTDWYRNHKECEFNLIDAIAGYKQRRNNSAGSNVDSRPDHSPGTVQTEAAELAGKPLSQEPGKVLDSAVEYQICSSLSNLPRGELTEIPVPRLAQVVAQIVEVESPVHLEEVLRRVRTFWKLNRSGPRVQEAIFAAVDHAEKNKLVYRKDDFLWRSNTVDVVVRRRSGDPAPNIEFICDEEIIAAIELVLKNQFATLPAELAVQASRLLGVRATSDKTADRIGSLIDKLMLQKRILKKPNGMVDFANN